MAALNAQLKKKEVCAIVLSQLAANADYEAVIASPAFAQELEAHFDRLPTRYALYVRIDRADDVLTHKRLLEEVRVSEHLEQSAFHVRAVPTTVSNVHEDADDEVVDDPVAFSKPSSRLQLPTHKFGQPSTDHEVSSSSEFNSSCTELNNTTDNYASENDSQSSSTNNTASNVAVHEVTIARADKPKLLSLLSAMLADIGLNIREAHVFSTTDGFSLDVFVVDGWPTQDVEDMNQTLLQALSAMQADSAPEHDLSLNDPSQLDHVQILETTNDWEIDSSHLKFIRKVTTGSCGDLYQGSYYGQDVAIKVIKSERMNKIMRREFQQEVYIMRKVRHKNIVQFIGACTKSPNFCIVTEYMSGGSVYDYLHKQKKAALKMPTLLKVAIDVSKGMDYLHQNHILHRDLKAANLLMDENEVVKVADFGVARVQAQSGIMTAETGTYRWMAPEVIEHKPYDTKADVFSFGVVLWELLTGKVPYNDLTPLQAAVGVVQKGLRPIIPGNINPRLRELLQRCWNTNSTERPDFSEITALLEEILKQVNQAGLEAATTKYKDKHLAGLFTALKRSPIRG